jgi:hypothetical protein
MRAMRAEAFNGYEELKLVDLPKPAVTDGKVLVRNHCGGGYATRLYDSLRQVSQLQATVGPGQ